VSGSRKSSKRVYLGWGIELDDYDRRFLVGIGYSHIMTGAPADWSKPLTTLTFKTRKEARAALARQRASTPWSFKGKRAGLGGNRIYRSGRVVALKITVEAA
jgi:hypothetical protein